MNIVDATCPLVRDIHDEIKELEKDFSKDKPLYNKNAKLSLKTIASYALEPWETFFFEGRCQLGVGV